eukprot:Rmarinus@m.27857
MRMRLWLLALLAASAALCASALTFDVKAGTEECFFEDVSKQGIKLGGMFQVAEGGELDIDFQVTDPDGNVVYSAEKEKEGKFAATSTSPGSYSFCFSNKMSKFTAKAVSFYVTVGSQFESEEVAKAEHLSTLESSIANLAEGLTAIQSEQKYMRMRERVHQQSSQQTNMRVLILSVVEALVLVGVSVAQIYYLRRFFEVKRVV